MVRELRPLFVNICETKLTEKNEFKIKYYNVIRNDKELKANQIAHGGVLSLVHESIQFKVIKLKTKIQAVAYEVKIPFKHTICNVYLDFESKIKGSDIRNLITQLGEKFLIVGDFNCHHTSWNSAKNDSRGRELVKICEENSLVILNDGYDTRLDPRTGKSSCLDLAIATANIADEISCSPMDDLCGSDHFPIFNEYDRFSNPLMTDVKENNKLNLCKTDWSKYQEQLVFTELREAFKIKDVSVDLLVEKFNECLFKAAKAATPKTSDNKKFKRIFWWTQELSDVTRRKKWLMNAWIHGKSEEHKMEHRKYEDLQRELMRETRRKSWEEFAMSINSHVSSAEAWKKIKAIKGCKNKSKRLIAVDIEGESVTQSEEVAKAFAQHFYEVSKKPRELEEDKEIKVELNVEDEESFNVPFREAEIEEVLAELKGSSAGEDEIHNLMLKNLNKSGKIMLLAICNKIWTEGRFPKKWKSAIVVPVKKPGADGDVCSNFRGICLLSCSGKVMERMTHKRLSHYLETRKLISKNQSGFRKYRSTADNLVTLEHNVMENFAKKKSTIAVFFDLEKAYDTTSRNLIKRELIKKGISGRMLKYLINFMEERKFKVKINGEKSEEKLLENGLPQGSVLSCVLFNIAIEALLRAINDPVRALLFADDLVIFASGKNNVETGNIIQDTLRKLHSTASNLQFKFSAIKTKAMIFTRKWKKNIIEPTLFLGDSKIEIVSKYKFLGMIFDSKLNWNAHIDYISDKARKSLNVIRVLSNQNWGSDSTMLIRMHKALVMSLMDYGSFLFQNASQKALKKLDVINNQGMRLAIGAFKSTPIESLHAETGIMKLDIRRSLLGMGYLTKIMACQDHPAHEDWIEMAARLNKQKRTKNNSKACFMTRSLIEYQKIEGAQDIRKIDDTFFCRHPPWMIENVKFDLYLTRYKKDETPEEKFKLEFEKRKKSNIRIAKAEESHEVIYTDGSLKNGKTGFAVCSEQTEFKCRLADRTSIYTAELNAISTAVEVGGNCDKKLIMICSDSLSSIQALMKIYSRDQTVMKIQEKIFQFPNKEFVFIWVPSHKGILGNEKADILANEALLIEDENVTDIPITIKDLKNRIKTYHREKIFENWQKIEPTKNKLRKIKSSVGPVKNLKMLKRSEAMKITRLRLGHTRLTHGHFMAKEDPRKCKCDETLTVEHIFNDCPMMRTARKKFKIESIHSLGIDKEENYRNIVRFLKKTKLYHEI